LPAVDELLDSASAVATLSGDSTFRGAFELLAIGIDTAGVVQRVRILETDLATDVARRLATVLAGMIELQPPGPPSQLRLTVQLSPPGQVFVARSELCRLSMKPGPVRSSVERIGVVRVETPDSRNRSMTGAPADPPSLPLDALPPPLVFRWLVRVDADGQARDAIALTRVSGLQVDEGKMRAAVLHLKYNPALLDRVPVAMTDTVTMIGDP
jgi:hypothetical protein